MLVYLADLAHTYSTKNESLMVPLNIGYVKSYAMEQHGKSLNIKLFKNPKNLLVELHKNKPDLLGFSNYGWNENLNLKIGKFAKLKYQDITIVSGGPNIDDGIQNRIFTLILK